MKYLVCISKVPDTTAKISFKNEDKEFNSDGVTFIMNPTDEWYALVRALELKEASGGQVTVINVGPKDNEKFLRSAIAIGADDAVLIEANEETESYYIAKNIAKYAQENGYNFVITGKETISFNSFSLGGMIAEFMDLPFINQATQWMLNGEVSTIYKEIEGGEEVLEVTGNCVISAQKGMAEQRLANMKGIMMAKTKPLAIIPIALGEEKVQVSQYQVTPPRGNCKMFTLDQIDELVQALQSEAKVI
ncbi:MAG: electron transfer flavoprotein subunit beta/FixA family protein [Chitinophagales bacterium]|jgi:electron transfer flavoprotein beta subunit|nr:electron transfer flavoprotein subunit beta/FixA family protein [Chitinophagales bacterium]